MEKTYKTRFFLHCPHGFVNERILMATDSEEVTQAVHKRLDDGMAGTLEEVSEKEAKRLYYIQNVDAYIETAVRNSEREFETYPKWDDLKYFLTLNTRLEYE